MSTLEDVLRRPKLLERVRPVIRLRHYSRRTEEAYVGWIRRFIIFHGLRHPAGLGEREVTAFLSAVAGRGMSASSQNQALSALLFLYGEVLGHRLSWMQSIVRQRRPEPALSRSWRRRAALRPSFSRRATEFGRILVSQSPVGAASMLGFGDGFQAVAA